MSEQIKWISELTPSGYIQDLLNKYKDLIIAESLQVSSTSLLNGEPYSQVTFLLNKTFNDNSELNRHLEKGGLF